MTKEIDLTIAQTIAEQIGNGAFLMMGTTQKLADGHSLMFDVKGCRKVCQKIRVTLNVNDLYTVEFIKIGIAPKYKITTSTHIGIYAEDLHSLIERVTGLRLAVPRIRGLNA